ncbi:hypothetical protein BOX15_Mlig018943g2, partial [Macrostomum lignano]
LSAVTEMYCESNRAELKLALRDGDLKAAERLLTVQPHSADAEDPDGSRPLHVAAAFCAPAVRLLLKHGVGLDCPSDKKVGSPLFVAVFCDQLDAVEVLIRAGADVHFCSTGSPALWVLAAASRLAKTPSEQEKRILSQMRLTLTELAMLRGHREILNLLLSMGADFTTAKDNGFAAIQIAALCGRMELTDCLVGVLLESQKRNELYASPLHLAAKRGLLEFVRFLIRSGANVDLQLRCSNATPLYIAAQHGHAEVISLLAESGTDLNFQTNKGRAALHAAAQSGRVESAQALIKHGANIDLGDKDGCTPLIIAARHGHTAVITELLQAGIKIDHQTKLGATALLVAAKNGKLDVVRKLLASNANINLADCKGFSPLHAAAQNSQANLVDLLVAAGANIDSLTRAGDSPLCLATSKGRVDATVSLIRAGACGNSLWPKPLSSPMFAAAKGGHIQVIEKLIGAQADVDVQTKKGSPLMIAARNGHIAVVASLVQAGANLNQRNRRKESPLLVALENGHTKVAKLLIQSQATIEPWLTALAMSALPSSISASDSSDTSLMDSCESLSSEMRLAGFTAANAAMQSRIAATLEFIQKQRLPSDQFSIVGSFSDGWGMCFTQNDGKLDPDSDIDMTALQQGPVVKVCSEHSYSDGHIEIDISVSEPSVTQNGSMLRPNMDFVTAYPLSEYPTIAVLQSGYQSCIPSNILKSLADELKNSPCHLVAAAPPGLSGKRMRVSTNLLERRLMQSLTDEQGQVFVLLKYIIKKVISAKVNGLKTYHAKNTFFFMLDGTPREHWTKESLHELVRRSLELLLKRGFHNTRTDFCSPHQCMQHFFLRDAFVYLHRNHHPKSEIRRAIEEVICNLSTALEEFRQGLCKNPSMEFQFHPFLLLPVLEERSFPTAELQYHDTYDVIKYVLLSLADDNFEKTIKEEINSIPDWARTARECLRAMALMRTGKSGYSLVAPVSTVSKSIPSSVEDVLRYLQTNDSAWKFYFRFHKKVEFKFLPAYLREIFPLSRGSRDQASYINFDALSKALRLEFIRKQPNGNEKAAELFNTFSWDYGDPQDLGLLLHYCLQHSISNEQLMGVFDRRRKRITAAHLSRLVSTLLDAQPNLKHKLIENTLRRPSGASLATDIVATHELAGSMGTKRQPPAPVKSGQSSDVRANQADNEDKQGHQNSNKVVKRRQSFTHARYKREAAHSAIIRQGCVSLFDSNWRKELDFAK